jgi:hypothetical protein
MASTALLKICATMSMDILRFLFWRTWEDRV